MLALGCLEGHIFFYDMDTKQKSEVNKSCGENVVDLAWNPGDNLLIALFENGRMCMFSVESLTLAIIFEKQPTGISSCQWVDNISGDIITSTNKVGALRLWSASNENPKDMIKVGPHGISTIHPIKGK
jgi:WD40 repeat protein